MTVETVEYRVRRGESLQDIVQAAGFPRRDWRRIYDAPYNRSFRSRRPDPDHIEPGDRFMLPRYNTRQIADIVQRIQFTERRFQQMNRDLAETERDNARLEAEVRDHIDLSDRKFQKRVADLQRRSDALLDLAAAAANECTDAYTCAGAGAAAGRMEARARRFRDEARRLQRNIGRGEKEAVRALQTIRQRLQELGRAQAETEREISRLRAQYRRAAQNLY